MNKEEQKPLVRIVDDEQTVRNSERFVFAVIGLDSVCYESAENFLEQDDFRRPGCIVLDVRMKDMSGLELQQVLSERGCDLPIVFLSGYGTVESAVNALKNGAYDFLEKPAKAEKLQAVALKLIEKNLTDRRNKAHRRSLRAKYDSLTARERDVVELVARGEANKVIAAKLGISEQTVKIHRGNAMYKLQIKTAVDAHELLSEIEMLKTSDKTL